MESALGWLGDIIRAIGRIIPRMLVVQRTHGGVAFVRGKHVREIKPGLFWWWPLWTKCILYPVVRQSLNLPSQSLTTQDSLSVTISGVVIYRVMDVVAALTRQWDLNETIRDLSMVAIREVVGSRPFDSINQKRREIDWELKEKLQDSLAAYGVEVLQIALTDFAKAKVISLVGGSDMSYIDDED